MGKSKYIDPKNIGIIQLNTGLQIPREKKKIQILTSVSEFSAKVCVTWSVLPIAVVHVSEGAPCG